jgi:hypothetical protein
MGKWMLIIWQGLLVLLIVVSLGYALYQTRTNFEVERILAVVEQECDHMQQDAAYYARCNLDDELSDHSFYLIWLDNTRARILYGLVTSVLLAGALAGTGLLERRRLAARKEETDLEG